MVKSDIIYEKDESDIFVDLIKSKISPDLKFMCNLLQDFYTGEIGNCFLSDSCEEYWNNLAIDMERTLNLTDDFNIFLVIVEPENYASCNITPDCYPNALDWQVFNRLEKASQEHLLITDVEFILNTLKRRSGEDTLALEKWSEYWKNINFKNRTGIAPL